MILSELMEKLVPGPFGPGIKVLGDVQAMATDVDQPDLLPGTDGTAEMGLLRFREGGMG